MRSHGFVAITSAIIISVVLLVLVATGGYTGFFGRGNVFDTEMKGISSGVAEACADQALLRLAANPAAYDSVGETVVVSGTDCVVSAATGPASAKEFTVSANYKNYVTKYRLVVDTSDVSVTFWEEVP